MTGGGTKIHCPRCHAVSVCRAIPPTRLNEPSAQRISNERYDDLHWFRRGRECLGCGHLFLTGELNEAFIHELVDLRTSWLARIHPLARSARRKAQAAARAETVPLDDAQAFIRATAFWDHPTSYSYARAPKHAKRIYKHPLGWAVDYGANTFLPGMAISRCNRVLASIFEELENGKLCFREDAVRRLMQAISGCVATQDGYEYNGYYPMEGDYLRFGTQLIDTELGAKFILGRGDPKGILLPRLSAS